MEIKIEDILKTNHGDCPGDELQQMQVVNNLKKKLLIEEEKLEKIKRYRLLEQGMVEYATALLDSKWDE